MYVILIAISSSLLFLSSTSSSRLLTLLFASFRFSPAEILISTHVLSPNPNCKLCSFQNKTCCPNRFRYIRFGNCVNSLARASIPKLYEACSTSEKTHNIGGVGSRVVYKNMETSSAIHDNSGNLEEKRPLDRCGTLRPD
jgi:hypothetical protein